MNFTRLLAASRSVMGLKKKPGPYKMSQDHLLPKFNLERKAGTERAEAGDGRACQEAAQCRTEDRPEASPALASAPLAVGGTAVNGDLPAPAVSLPAFKARVEPARAANPRKFMSGWAASLAKATPWRSKAARAKAGGGRPVQAELSLESVQVVCNDLSDCDFQVVLVEPDTARQAAVENGASNGHRPALGMVWNRLTARLLRQAAQDFTLVQKERGKLFSQAGNGSPGVGSP